MAQALEERHHVLSGIGHSEDPCMELPCDSLISSVEKPQGCRVPGDPDSAKEPPSPERIPFGVSRGPRGRIVAPGSLKELRGVMIKPRERPEGVGEHRRPEGPEAPAEHGGSGGLEGLGGLVAQRLVRSEDRCELPGQEAVGACNHPLPCRPKKPRGITPLKQQQEQQTRSEEDMRRLGLMMKAELAEQLLSNPSLSPLFLCTLQK